MSAALGSSTSALQARGVSARLGDRPVLHAIDLDLRQGAWTSIVGPNGAGKSTLLRALAGLLPCAGEITLLQRPLRQWPARERGRTVAWLGQGEQAAHDLRVLDVVMLGRLPHRGWLAAPGAASQIKTVGQLNLGPGQRLLTVEVGQGEDRTWLVLGVTGQSIQTLHTMAPQAAPEPAAAPVHPGFAALLRRSSLSHSGGR